MSEDQDKILHFPSGETSQFCYFDFLSKLDAACGNQANKENLLLSILKNSTKGLSPKEIRSLEKEIEKQLIECEGLSDKEIENQLIALTMVEAPGSTARQIALTEIIIDRAGGSRET